MFAAVDGCKKRRICLRSYIEVIFIISWSMSILFLYFSPLAHVHYTNQIISINWKYIYLSLPHHFFSYRSINMRITCFAHHHISWKTEIEIVKKSFTFLVVNWKFFSYSIKDTNNFWTCFVFEYKKSASLVFPNDGYLYRWAITNTWQWFNQSGTYTADHHHSHCII